MNRIGGANLGARAAFDAFVGIDVIDVAFGDCFYGANGQAGAACYAGVSDYVSHNYSFLEVRINFFSVSSVMQKYKLFFNRQSKHSLFLSII